MKMAAQGRHGSVLSLITVKLLCLKPSLLTQNAYFCYWDKVCVGFDRPGSEINSLTATFTSVVARAIGELGS